jgi:hypothetical protein
VRTLTDEILPVVLVGCSMCLTECGYSAHEALPDVKTPSPATECSMPAPAALQVAGEDIETACRPAGGPYFADVGLTVSAEGRVIAVRIGESTTPAVASCVRRIVPSMRFLVADPCNIGSAEIDLAFGAGGVS